MLYLSQDSRLPLFKLSANEQWMTIVSGRTNTKNNYKFGCFAAHNQLPFFFVYWVIVTLYFIRKKIMPMYVDSCFVCVVQQINAYTCAKLFLHKHVKSSFICHLCDSIWSSGIFICNSVMLLKYFHVLDTFHWKMSRKNVPTCSIGSTHWNAKRLLSI